MSYAIYERATKELFGATYGKLEDRDRIKVVQLFDRLLMACHTIHVDDLRRLCRDVGYDEQTADDIGLLYDVLCLIRHELENPNTIDYWRSEVIEQLVRG